MQSRLLAPPAANQTSTAVLRIVVVIIVLMTGCWKTPPERPLVSGDYPAFSMGSMSASQSSTGAWTLSSASPELSFPYGTGKVMARLTMECDAPDRLPDTLICTLADEEDVIHSSFFLHKRLAENGTLEFVADIDGINPKVGRVSLKATCWLLQDESDLGQLVLPVKLIDR